MFCATGALFAGVAGRSRVPPVPSALSTSGNSFMYSGLSSRRYYRNPESLLFNSPSFVGSS